MDTVGVFSKSNVLILGLSNPKAPIQHEILKGLISGGGSHLKRVLTNCKYDPFKTDSSGKNSLHLAAQLYNQFASMKWTQILLEIAYELNNPLGFQDFLNKEDKDNNTPISLAAKNSSFESLIILIKWTGSKNISNKTVELIHLNAPNAIETIYTNCINRTKIDTSTALAPVNNNNTLKLNENTRLNITTTNSSNNDGENEKYQNIEYHFNFRPLLDPEDEHFKGKEKTYIEKFGWEKCKDFICHPLIKTFICLKWQKIKSLFWISFLLHICWLSIFVVHVANVYITNCPISSGGNFSRKIVTGGGSRGGRIPQIILEENSCAIDAKLRTVSILLFISTLFFTFKEIYKCSIYKLKYFTNLTSLGTCILIIVSFIETRIIFYNQVELAEWNGVLGALALFIVWLLLLSQFRRLGLITYYTDIFSSIMKEILILLFIFSTLLAIFIMAIFIAVPKKAIFLNYPGGKLKLIENFDELLRGKWFGISAVVIFVLISIIFLYYLFGITHNDFQKLAKYKNEKILFNKLMQISRIDTLLFSEGAFKMILSRIGWLSKLERFILVNNKDKELIVKKNDLPAYLTDELELLIKNKDICLIEGWSDFGNGNGTLGRPSSSANSINLGGIPSGIPKSISNLSIRRSNKEPGYKLHNCISEA